MEMIELGKQNSKNGVVVEVTELYKGGAAGKGVLQGEATPLVWNSKGTNLWPGDQIYDLEVRSFITVPGGRMPKPVSMPLKEGDIFYFLIMTNGEVRFIKEKWMDNPSDHERLHNRSVFIRRSDAQTWANWMNSVRALKE